MKRSLSILALFACVVEITLAGSISAQAPDAQEAVKLKATLVNVPVIVSDRQGRYLSGLRAEDFTLYNDHVKQTITVFEATEEPLNVALLLDTSKSTSAVLDNIKDAALNFIKHLRTQDRAMVISFYYDFDIFIHV